MMSRLYSIVSVYIQLIVAVVGQTESCSSFNVCESCYGSEGCQWCFVLGVGYSCVPRSANESCLGSSTAEAIFCQNPKGIKEQVPISRVIVSLYPDNSTSFEFTVERLPNPELDFYMLMDLSFSLWDDLDTIKSFTEDIANEIENITSNYSIGLGTFVDKLTYPYVPEFILDGLPFNIGGTPSACRVDICVAPFSYTHLLNLTNDKSSFISTFDSLGISTNADTPEGTLDAISQAVLCKDLVGWRDNSIKILFVITDATAHMAGDGRLAGIFKQYPNECKTVYDSKSNSFTYLENTNFDYPSIGQIRETLFSYSVTPVFAVTEEVQTYYENLGGMLMHSRAQVVTTGSSSANIITAIQSSYENIVSNVELNFANNVEGMTIDVIATCPDGVSSDASCGNITVGDTVQFQVNVSLDKCRQRLSRVIPVKIPGYGQFDLDVRPVADSCQ